MRDLAYCKKEFPSKKRPKHCQILKILANATTDAVAYDTTSILMLQKKPFLSIPTLTLSFSNLSANKASFSLQR